MSAQNLRDQRMEAQLREADARLSVLQAQAEARKAREEMDEIAGLQERRESARRKLTDLKQRTSENLATARREVETAVHELQAGIERVSARYATWDAAREREFKARVDEAEAKLAIWKARADQQVAGARMKGHDELAKLKERIELARARFAERRAARHDRKAQEALAAARRHLDEAFDAAAKRFEG